MDAALSQIQRERLESEEILIDGRGLISDSDNYFPLVGVRREARWSDGGAGVAL